MKRFILIYLFFLLFTGFQLFGQNHTIYLIGDAGEDNKPGKALKTLKSQLEKDSLSSVIFLGDNAYPAGVSKVQITESSVQPYLFPEASKLLAQLTILKNYKGNVFFVNGNHDWRAQKKRKSVLSVRNEELIVESYLDDSTQVRNKSEMNLINHWLYLKDASKSSFQPKIVDVNEQITLLLFDSQYFFQKMRGVTVKDKKELMDLFFQNCDSIIALKFKEGRKVIMASHHPVFTNGNHARFRQPLRFIFNWTPFWFLGKVGIDRWLSQDIEQPLYKKYREKFNLLLEKHAGIIVAAGHDHNLQVMDVGDDVHLVSGAGSKLKKLRRKERFVSVYSEDKKEGFIKLVFDEAGKYEIQIISDENEILYKR